MKKLFLFTSILLHCTFLLAQDVPALIREADKLESSLKESSAYEKFKQVLKIEPRNYYALWKCSELCSRIVNRQNTKEKKADFFNAGRIYAETAIKTNPNGADGYYALAVAMGRRALMESGKDKVKAVKEIKINAEKAIKLNARHWRAWHVIGKWHYEVNNLSTLEKAALKIFYGGLPQASLTESIKAYERAMQLEPDFALNFLELAKAYKKNDQKDKAIVQLTKLAGLRERTEDDARIKSDGRKLLQTLQS